MPSPRVLILRSAGTNCDAETAHAFERAGGRPEFLHVNRLLEKPEALFDFGILAIPGGFSYGDDISAGRILAQQISSVLMEPLRKFIASGRPVAGICNGFQVLVKTDLLPGRVPGFHGHPATLAHNTVESPAKGRFQCRWIDLAEESSSKCVWTKGVGTLTLPIAHGEGRFVPASDAVLGHLEKSGQIALRYAGENPNGSTAAIAGVCDESGLVFGLMPHPERHVRASQHPAWTKLGSDADAEGPGLKFFRNAVAAVK